jgi:hypothetical protein
MKKPLPISNSRQDFQPGRFRKSLLTWYDAHARDLPWRASQIAPAPKFKTLGNSKP